MQNKSFIFKFFDVLNEFCAWKAMTFIEKNHTQ